jgi:Ca2+/Na+ antiporter
VSADVIYGLTGLFAGAVLGLAGFMYGRRHVRRSGGMDERFELISALAARLSWRLTLAGMIVMWALVQFRAITSPAVAVGAVYLLSIAAYVIGSVYLERRH